MGYTDAHLHAAPAGETELQRNCSNERNMPPISALFSNHFYHFSRSSCWKTNTNPIYPTNQPYIHQSQSASINASGKAFANPFISIEMCEDYMFRQTRNCARICQTHRPQLSFGQLQLGIPTPPTPWCHGCWSMPEFALFRWLLCLFFFWSPLDGSGFEAAPCTMHHAPCPTIRHTCPARLAAIVVDAAKTGRMSVFSHLPLKQQKTKNPLWLQRFFGLGLFSSRVTAPASLAHKL